MLSAKEVSTYRRDECATFRKTAERWGGFSNMAGGFPVAVNGVVIRTSEALYQACRFPHLPDVQRLIIAQASPMTAKMKSKPYRKDSRPDWEGVKVAIMRWTLQVKLACNVQGFGNLLLASGDRAIVEDSRRDPFWCAQPSREDPTLLVGHNVLGHLLMELREALRAQGVGALTVVPPLDIPDFLLYEQPIGVVKGNG